MIGNLPMVRGVHTGCLLLTVPNNSANDGILLAGEAVDCTLGVPLGLSGIVLSLPRCVFLFAGLGPCLGAGQVTHILDNCALERVVLPGGFAIQKCQRPRLQRASVKETYEGSVRSVLLDMSKRIDV